MSGIFGVVNGSIDDLFYGVDYHSHLGSEFAGLGFPGERPIIHKLNAQFKSKFSNVLQTHKSKKTGIGVISSNQEQPIGTYSRHGYFLICTNGRIFNEEELFNRLLEGETTFTESVRERINQTELAAKIIAKENSIEEGIEKLFNAIDGSLSLLLLTEKGNLYAARAKHGHSTLIIGKKENAFAVTTETCAFNNLGYFPIKELMPGEIVLITEKGLETKAKGNHKSKICAFLYVYTGFPASEFEGINVEEARYRCGAFLAKRDKAYNYFKQGIVAGVPDSGLAHAIGYANASGMPLKRPLVKYTDGYGRSYIPTTQEERDIIAKMKLIAIPRIAKDAVIFLLEDSIVRGTQLKNFTIKKLQDIGAKEIHLRVACPPLMFPCKYNISTRALEELIARRAIKQLEGTFEPANIEDYLDPNNEKYKQMVELIRKELNVTSLRFQTLEDMIEAIGLPEDRLCTYCWTGKEI